MSTAGPIETYIRDDGTTSHRLELVVARRRTWIDLGSDSAWAESTAIGVRTCVEAGHKLTEIIAYAERQRALAPAKVDTEVSSLLRLVTCYIAVAKKLKIDPVTARVNARRLLRVVEVALLARNNKVPRKHSTGGKRLARFSDYISAHRRLSVLRPRIVEEYGAVKFRGLVPGTPEHDAASMSFATELQSIRNLFTEEALLEYQRAGVVLPELKDFVDAALQPKPERNLECPSMDLIPRAHAVVDSLTGEAKVVAHLALFDGLTIVEMQSPSAIQGANVQVRMRSKFARFVGLSDRTAALLSGRTTLFLGSKKQVDAATRQATAALAGQGIDGLPQLRDLCTWYVLTRYTLAEVPSRLGHRSPSTTERFEGWPELPDDLVSLWEDAVLAAAA